MLIKKLKYKLKKNKTVFYVYRILRYCRMKDFQDLIRGYRGPDVVLVQHPGEKNPEKFVYYISSLNTGFFAEIQFALCWLCYADRFHLTPVIDWGSNCLYLESEPVNGTKNAFEYYFKPVSDISYKNAESYYNVVYSSWNQIGVISPDLKLNNWSYRNGKSFVRKFSQLYKKYFVLNEITRTYIDESIEKKLVKKKTLGVHIRGTDFKKSFDAHPVCINAVDFVPFAEKLMKRYGYEQIFLATDSLEAVELFKKEFGSSLVYYKDVLRSDGNVGVHYLENERKNHHYLLGLEVLRDAYTLAACDSLLAGMSNVSLAAQYIKIAEGSCHEEVKILDQGINDNHNSFESCKEKS